MKTKKTTQILNLDNMKKFKLIRQAKTYKNN